ncbi:helix-turn-helix domain-containing protein [Rugamonas rivuli]|uniref:Helix-turn-helix domain-containing protein n=1 Tax=Rugamonas rivuli TaxID=2743358 RepID=A0A843SGB2_9BURK|nr:helix-turn-helix transcriptional regulator [Rugamonas rivuli]MQA23655.1 helix-turn-helix domain-containing protein [Rugamonas rivuli]
MSVFSKRLKEARTRAGVSQERLGVLAGIDEMSSSARMNQYERAKHEPDFSMVERIAKALNVPESYFYAKDDEAAWLLVVFHRLPAEARLDVLQAIKDVVENRKTSVP